MTTVAELIRGMLLEPTAHSIIDSGAFYGRTYQRNASRDFTKEPEAVLKIGKWGPEVSVSTYHHLTAVLELDKFCTSFNNLPCEKWDGEQFYGTSAEQELWLGDRGFSAHGNSWNSYNWDNFFDQTLQGGRLERDGEEYVLLQIHGGCDVRSGYTDAKLFKIDDWAGDYFMSCDCQFDIDRATAEAAGYPITEVTEYGRDSDWITVQGLYGYDLNIFDPRLSEDVDIPEGFWDKFPHQTIEGQQNAVHF